MKPRIPTFRLIAATVAGIGVFLLGSVPASAQGYAPNVAPDISQDVPWYMPQPWVAPPQTGPKIRKLPGYYGHNYQNRSYGSFGNGCYGDCRYPRGTVMTGSGYVLHRPTVAIFDSRDYQVVPRSQLQTLPAPPVAVSRPAPAEPAIVSARKPTPRLIDMKPRFATQNGVRVIRPEPTEGY